jgi:hypothetical protein
MQGRLIEVVTFRYFDTRPVEAPAPANCRHCHTPVVLDKHTPVMVRPGTSSADQPVSASLVRS